MTGETFTCAVCGGEYDLDQRREFDDQDLCPDCLEQETETCSVCGERIWSDNNAGDSDTPLCQSCYERLYTNCTRCGALIPNARVFYAWDDVGNEEPLCRDCYSRSADHKAIQDYYYKPDPIFYGKGPRYFGWSWRLMERESAARMPRRFWIWPTGSGKWSTASTTAL